MRKIKLTISNIHPIINELLAELANNPHVNGFDRRLSKSAIIAILALKYIENCVQENSKAAITKHLQERLTEYYRELEENRKDG